MTVDLDGPSWYRFRAGGFTSPAGRVAPTSDGTAPLRLATASCQHFETGFYAAHRDIAEWAPDAVVFLGDFIYEGASNPVGDGRVRSHDGPEPMDLAGYRARYAQYLSDPDLRAARACCPWLVIWDDHEVENNYAGLEPQDPAERDGFAARRAAAYRAWWEHMPVRLPAPVDGADYPMHRAVSWGGRADLVLLDGRQYRERSGVRRRLAVDRAAVPRGPRPGPHDARRGAGGVAGERARRRARRRGPCSASRPSSPTCGCRPGRSSTTTSGTGTPRPGTACSPRPRPPSGSSCSPATSTSPASAGSPASAPSSSRRRSRRRGLDPSLQPVLASFPDVVDAELAHRGYTRHAVTPETWTAEYRIVDDATAPDSPVSTWRTFQVAAHGPRPPDDDVTRGRPPSLLYLGGIRIRAGSVSEPETDPAQIVTRVAPDTPTRTLARAWTGARTIGEHDATGHGRGTDRRHAARRDHRRQPGTDGRRPR